MRLLPLLAALALLPTAAAQGGDPLCIIFIEPTEDWTTVRMRADLILDDQERFNISREADADASGDITQAEVDAYETAKQESFGPLDDMGKRLLYLDGELPRRLVVKVDLKNWTGPVETARNGTVTEEREYTFHQRAAYDYEHALSGGLGAHPYRTPKPVVETVVIVAPPGWYVASVGQAPEDENGTTTPPTSMGYSNLYGGSEPQVTISGFDLDRSYLMVFRDATPTYPSGGIPGPALALVVAAVVAAARYMRRSGT